MKRALIILMALLPCFAFASGGDWVSGLLNTRGPRLALSNPALLATPSSRLAIELPGAGAAASNNSFSIRYWNSRIAGDGFWDRCETRDIIRHIPAGGLAAQGNVTAPLVGVSLRNFAFNAQVIGGARANVPKVAAQLALIGSQLDEHYALSNLVGQSAAVGDYSLAYGRPISQPYLRSLSAGIALHVYEGLAFTETRNSTADLFSSESRIQGSGVFQADMGQRGSGFGADLGFAATISPRWKAGLVVQGIGARMNWKIDQTQSARFETDVAGLDVDSIDESDYLDNMVEHSDTTLKNGGSLSLALPTVIRGSANYQIRPDLNAAALLSINTRSTAFGKAGVEVGTAGEYFPLKWLLVQGGILVGGSHGSMFTLGTGLRFRAYEFDATFSSTGGLGNYARGGAAWISQRLFL